jgi:hypothetical protein
VTAAPRISRPIEMLVVGCHGGETPKHRTSGFVLKARGKMLAIDAGSLTSGLTLKEQNALNAVVTWTTFEISRRSPTTAVRRVRRRS